MEEVTIARSGRADKRLKATFQKQGKTIHFGAKGGSTYVDHQDAQKKVAWEARHKVRERWDVLTTAGALAKWLLWNRQTLAASVRDLNARQKKYKFSLRAAAA